jgi:hypothetical protein
MGKTDVIDYAEICNHAKRKRECPACAELADLRAENARLRNELRCICENDSRKLDEIKRLRAAHKPCPCCDAYWAEIPRPEGEES